MVASASTDFNLFLASTAVPLLETPSRDSHLHMQKFMITSKAPAQQQHAISGRLVLDLLPFLMVDIQDRISGVNLSHTLGIAPSWNSAIFTTACFKAKVAKACVINFLVCNRKLFQAFKRKLLSIASLLNETSPFWCRANGTASSLLREQLYRSCYGRIRSNVLNFQVIGL